MVATPVFTSVYDLFNVAVGTLCKSVVYLLGSGMMCPPSTQYIKNGDLSWRVCSHTASGGML